MDEQSKHPWTSAALELNRRMLMRYVLGATGRIADSEDIVQDILRIAYEKRESFKVGTDLGAWLRGIGRNCLRRYFTDAKREPILVGDAMKEFENVLIENETALFDTDWQSRRVTAMKNCLRMLSEKMRAILNRRFVQKQCARVVAQLHGMSENALNVAIFRARETLVECVKRKTAL